MNIISSSSSSKEESCILKNGASSNVLLHQEQESSSRIEPHLSNVVVKIRKENQQQDKVSVSVENLPEAATTFLTVVASRPPSADHHHPSSFSRSYNELAVKQLNSATTTRSPSSISLSPSMDDALLANRLAFSRSFTDRYQFPSAAAAAGRKSSSTMLDTKHIRIYMKRQNSRGSINSTASVGLGDVFGNSSRPVSAESTSGTDAFLTNVQVRSPRRLIPSLSRESCLVVNNSAKSAPGSAPRSSSIPAGLRARPLIGSFAELVCRPAPYLYMGGIEAANNANLLCRLNIESIVDVSNIERTKLPREKRSDCPCLCRLETAHCRSFFTAKIDENDNSDLITTFEDANEFIQKAILCGKSVLVHSYYGRNRCAVFVVQHLIKSQHLPLYRAIQFSATRNVVVKISQEKTVFSDDVMIFKVFDVIHHTKVRSLKRWETQCLGGGGDDDDFCSSSGGSGPATEISAALSDEAQPQRTNAAPPLLTTRTSFSSIIPASRRSAWM